MMLPTPHSFSYLIHRLCVLMQLWHSEHHSLPAGILLGRICINPTSSAALSSWSRSSRVLSLTKFLSPQRSSFCSKYFTIPVMLLSRKHQTDVKPVHWQEQQQSLVNVTSTGNGDMWYRGPYNRTGVRL